MEFISYITVIFILGCLSGELLEASPNPGGNQTYIGFFRRLPNKHLVNSQTLTPIRATKQFSDVSKEICAQKCVTEVEFQCRSFEYENSRRNCYLYKNAHQDPGIKLETGTGRDHFKTAYEKQFHRHIDHIITKRHNRKIDSVSVEECARRCIYEVVFQCRGFDYDRLLLTCWLTELDVNSAGGVLRQQYFDYYSKSTEEEIMGQFISYGYGRLRPIMGGQVYKKSRISVPNLEACAKECLEETDFHCKSFDYGFTDGKCDMSEYIAANVYGMDFQGGQMVMHYEKIEGYLNYFYPTPYAVILGNNHKTFNLVTPNRCARLCLHEKTFICRSFDYQINEGKCLLSTKTSSDVGGLFHQANAQLHHFEMKPYLDCGGDLTEEPGMFASPNWPRRYAPNEHCEWTITVPENKVIRFVFPHLDLGLQSSSPCTGENDKLIFTEILEPSNDTTSYCALTNTKETVSKTNRVNVTFVSNMIGDAAGFRVFYVPEWPCNVIMEKNFGEFASPNYPEKYLPSKICAWKIYAPPSHRIVVKFNFFQLESHTIGQCPDGSDHVAVYDGESNSAPLIGRYCGNLIPFFARSTGRFIFVQFSSDPKGELQGFHASYEFVENSETTTSTPPSTTVSSTKKSTATKPSKNVIIEVINGVGQKSGQIEPGPIASIPEDTGPSAVTWIIAVSLIALLIVVIVFLVFFCRYYRRHHNHRNKGYVYTVEGQSLWSEDIGDNLANQSTESSPEVIRENEYESIPALDPNVSFNNPTYGRNSTSESSPPFAEENQKMIS